MITVIIGRTGSGKSTLAKFLKDHGYAVLKTYTTRPKRTADEDTYHFITPEEAEAIADKVMVTHINGYEYFARQQDVETSDVAIVDPNGLKDMADVLPGNTFHVVYVSADVNDRKIHAVKRADDKIAEEMVFDKRNEDEDAQFSEFEASVQNASIPVGNCTYFLQYNNKFDEDDMKFFADMVADGINDHKMFLNLLSECIDLGIVRTDPETKKPIISILDDDGQPQTVTVPVDALVDKLLADESSALKPLLIAYMGKSERFKDIHPKQ